MTTHRLIILFVAITIGLQAQDQRNAPPNEQQPARQPQLFQNQVNFARNNQVPVFSQQPLGRQSGRLLHEPYQPPVTARKIRQAIEDAVLYLQNNQAQDGSIGGRETVLAALAMLAAGADPASDLSLQKVLAHLIDQNPNDTYVRGIRANVWEYALRKAPYDDSLSKALQNDYDWLLKALGDKEGWRYNMQSPDWDNSVTQYGVLGIWAASRAGCDPGREFWQRLSSHFQRVQNQDGGWGYQQSSSTANMATAGLATMFLVFDNHYGQACYTANQPNPFTGGEAAKVLASINRGMGWLGENTGNGQDGYYLYGIERTGVASGRKYIGGRDWFAEGVEYVLRSQQQDGSFAVGGHGGIVAHTAFSTLFLVYGGAPVAFNKLQYGSDESWNLNPRDLANLTRQLWNAYEQPLNWHAVDIQAPASEFEAPILFISGNRALDFSEEEMLKLREYVRRGGTILAEPSDYSEAFEQSIRQLARTLFPASAYPGWELKSLPETHPIYTVLPQDWHSLPKLEGISDGARTFFLLSRDYLSGDWQRNNVEADAYKLAMNLLFYATDMGMPPAKYASVLPLGQPAAERQITGRVARVRYSSDFSRDWDAAPYAWEVMRPYLKQVLGCALSEAPPVVLGKDSLEGIQLLHLTGRGSLKLTEAEREALRAFVSAGGYILADAYAGSPQFAGSAQHELRDLFGELTALPDDDLLASGQFAGGVDLSKEGRFTLPARKLLREAGHSPRGQHLLVAADGHVIFSAFDISGAMAGIPNYRAAAYQPETARAIIANILGLALAD